MSLNDLLASLPNEADAPDDLQSRLHSSISAGVEINPDKYAEAKIKGKTFGVNPLIAMSEEPTIKRAARLEEIGAMNLHRMNPRTAEVFSDPNVAAIGHDDIHSIRQIEDTFWERPAERFGGYTKEELKAREETAVDAANKARIQKAVAQDWCAQKLIEAGVPRGLIEFGAKINDVGQSSSGALTKGLLGLLKVPGNMQEVGLGLAVNAAELVGAQDATRAILGTANKLTPTYWIGKGAGLGEEQIDATSMRQTESATLTDPVTGEQFLNAGAYNPLTAHGLEKISQTVLAEAAPMAVQAFMAAETGGASVAAQGGKLARFIQFAKSVPTKPMMWLEVGRTVSGQYDQGMRQLIASGLTEEEANAKVAPGAALAGVLSIMGGAPMEASIVEKMAERLQAAPISASLKKRFALWASDFAVNGLKEGTQEILNGLGEDLAEYVTYNPDKTTMDFAINAYENFVGGAAMGSSMSSAISGYENIRRTHEITKTSKIFQRDADTFQKIVELQLKGSPSEKTYLNPDQFDSLFQTKTAADHADSKVTGMSREEALQHLGLSEASVQHAKETGVDLEIPTAQFNAAVVQAGGKLDPLDLLYKNSPDGMTALEVRNEVSKLLEQNASYAKSLGFERDSKAPLSDVAGRIAEDTEQKLKGLFLPETARVYAEYHARMLENIAHRFGADPMMLHEKYALKFVRGMPELMPSEDVVKAHAEQLYQHESADKAYTELEDSMGGKLLDVDLARRLDKHYHLDPSATPALHHESVSKFINRMFDKRMSTAPVLDSEGRSHEIVVLMAGGDGSGKGTTAKKFGLYEGAHTVLDGTFSKLGKAVEKIEKVLASGRGVVVPFTFRPVELAVNGMVARAHMGERRVVSLQHLAAAHQGALDTFASLMDKYASDPRVRFQLIDNSGTVEDAKLLNDTTEIRNFLESNKTEASIANRAEQAYTAIRGEGYVDPSTGTRQQLDPHVRAVLDTSLQLLTGAGGSTRGSDAAGLEGRPEGEGIRLFQQDPSRYTRILTPAIERHLVAARLSLAGHEKVSRNFEGRGRTEAGGLRGIIREHAPSESFSETLVASGITPTNVLELEKSAENAALFSSIMQGIKASNKFGAAVYVYSDEDYAKMKLFLAEDQKSGFAIKEDGDIVSVFSSGGGKAHVLLALAVEQGGTKLDCFDTVLPEIYSVSGFKEVGRDLWNDEYAPEGWDKETFKQYNGGEPSVVYMQYDPAYSPFAAAEDLVFFQSLSTRTPAGKGAIENHLEDVLTIDLEVAKRDPSAFEKNLRKLQSYINFRVNKKASVSAQAEQVVETMKENLLWLYRQMPADVREHAKLWYVGARRIADRWSASYGITDMQAAGMLAALSPQKDWFQNVSLAQRVLDIIKSHQRTEWTSEMSKKAAQLTATSNAELKRLLPKLKGKTYGELADNNERAAWIRVYDEAHNPRRYRMINPNGTLGDFMRNNPKKGERVGETTDVAWGSLNDIAKAVSIYYDGSKKNVSQALGDQHKVRNFYNNIFDPHSTKPFVTIDTHAVAAALLRGLGGSATEVLDNLGGGASSLAVGLKGTYPFFAEAYIRAAKEAGVLPREMQSITWEAIRSMYEPGFKRSETRRVNLMDKVLAKAAKGVISYKDAVTAITALKPELTKVWAKVARLQATSDKSAQQANAEIIAKAREKTLPILEGPIDKLWRDYQSGAITMDEARTGALLAAHKWRGGGGTPHIGKPSWVGYENSTIEANSTYYQGAEPAKHTGFIYFGTHNRISIGLLEGADLSTVVHELGHLYFKIMTDLVNGPNIQPDMRDRFLKLREWLGAEDGKPLTREQLEKFARANELYMREGRVPDKRVGPVFTRISAWMRLVYKRAGELGVRLNDDVRDFFDRMIATDDAIAEARHMVGFEPLYATAEKMGVPEPQFKAYVKLATEAMQQARKTVLDKALAQGERRHKQWWKSERKEVKDAVLAELDNRPDFRAASILQAGELNGVQFAISRDAAESELGTTALKKLGPKVAGLLKDTGAAPGTVAELLSMHGIPFGSGNELLQAIADLPSKRSLADKLTDQRMADKYGDMLLDGSMVDEAVAAIHNTDHAGMLQAELDALRKKMNEARPIETMGRKAQAQEEALKSRVAKTIDRHEQGEAMEAVGTLASFKARAITLVEQLSIEDLKPYSYLTASRRASKDAFKAMGMKDYERAVASKQQELLNHFMFLEAVKVQEEAQKIAKTGRHMESHEVQETLGLADPKDLSYQKQMNALLERYGWRRTTQEQTTKNQTLSEWAAVQEALGFVPAIAPEVLAEARKVNYRKVPITELRAVYDAMRNIHHIANMQVDALMLDRRVKFADEVEEAVATPVERKHLDHVSGWAPQGTEKVSAFFRGFDALAKKLVVSIDKLDQGAVDGVWRRNILTPVRHATAMFHQLAEEYTGKCEDALSTMPRKMRASLLDTVKVEGFNEPLTRKQIISMAFNMGNAENYAMLTNAEHNFTEAQVQEAVGHMTPEEWHFVQSMWSLLDGLRPMVGELEKRMSGVEPKWVKATPFDVNLEGGPIAMAGGYYPLAADQTSRVGQLQTPSPDQLFEAGYTRIATTHSHTQERTGAQYKLNLDFEQVLTKHLNSAIKDLAFREAIVKVNKFISNEDVRKTFREVEGVEMEHQLKPWLRAVVNDQNGAQAQGLGAVDKVANNIRSRVTNVMVAYKFSSAAVQAMDILRVFPLVKSRHMAAALVEYAASPMESIKFVRESSELMRYRSRNIDRDVREKFQQMLGDQSVAAKINRAGYAAFGAMDTAVSVPSWLAAYRQGLAKHDGDHALAAAEADRVIELSLQSGEAMDLVALQRNHSLLKMFTMFAGDGTACYSLIRMLGNNVKDAKSAAKLGGAVMISMVTANILADLIAGRGPDDDEDYGAWLARKAVLAPIRSLPVVRDMAEYVDAKAFGTGYADYRFSPIASALQTFADGAIAQKTFFLDDGDMDDWVWDTGTAAAYAFGVPGGSQITKTGKYLEAISTGDEEVPSNPAELAWRTATGTKH